jgi:peptide deformylase
MEVLKYPHPILKHKTKPTAKINQRLRDIVAEMFTVMYDTDGVGLAANQVGLPLRLFVMNPTGKREEKNEEYVFINPVILKRHGTAEDEEGCLSYPDIRVPVVRSESIEFEGIAIDDSLQQFQWKGHPARVVQHELDHLNGVGFVERLSSTALLTIQEDLDDLRTEFEGNQRLGFIPSDTTIAHSIAELESEWI